MIVVDATPLQTEHRFRGIGQYTEGLLGGLAHGTHDVSLAVLLGVCDRPDPAAGGASDPALSNGLLQESRFDVVPLRRPAWRRSRLRWQVGRIGVRRALGQSRARVFHATDPYGLTVAPGVATIATLYDLIPLHDPGVHLPIDRLDNRLGYARYLRLLRRCDRLIAISEATKADAVERLRIAPDKIHVTPLAVDERCFYPRPPGVIKSLIERYGLRTPYFLYVGSSDAHKNVSTLLRAFDALWERRVIDHALYIAGRWPAQAIAALARTHGKLLADGRLGLLGYVPDAELAGLYSGATAFVYPSLIEGFGLPVLEAMRCGTPVLTSTMSSLPEVVGDAALLVDPRDAEEVAHGMERLAHDDHVRLGLRRRGLERASQFSWRRTADATLRVYQGLL